MSAAETFLRGAALFLGLLASMFGFGYFVAAIWNPRTRAPRQFALSSARVTAAIFLLAYALMGSLPY